MLGMHQPRGKEYPARDKEGKQQPIGPLTESSGGSRPPPRHDSGKGVGNTGFVLWKPTFALWMP